MARLQGIPDVDHEYKSLRLSALTNAIKIAPYVNETTIGPNSLIHNSPAISQVDDYSQDSLDSKISKSIILPPEEVNNTNNGTVSYEKILHECEVKQREAADLMFHSMLNRMIAKRADMMTKFWHQQELEYEKRSQERRNREIEILQEWALGDRMAKLEQEKLDEENRAHSDRMRKLLEKQLESTRLFECLNSCHSEMCSLYEEITNISTSDDPLFHRILHKLEPSLSSLLSSMNLITERCKSGSITSTDVNKATSLTNKMRNLKLSAIEDLRTANEEQANKLAQEALNKQKEIEESVPKVQNIISTPNDSNVKSVSIESPTVKFCSNKSVALYTELEEFLIQYEKNYQSLLEDPNFKTFRFDCQKAVNTPVNAISSVSGTHLKDKYDKLLKLLSGERVRVGDSYIACSSHPQGVAYCTDLLAKKLVRQGDQLVSSSPDAAFPLASIIVALWARFPDLGKLILAHFHRDCPYIIPMILPQCEGQTDEEFYKMRGYRYNEDGSVEKQDKFLKRMSGIFRLCAAIWVTKMPYSVGGEHPQGLSHAWRWMAAFINLDPEADISATLLHELLCICGAEFFKHYKRQFVKVLNLLLTGYREKIDKIDEGGPKVRLEAFLQNIIKDGGIPPPSGALPDKMW